MWYDPPGSKLRNPGIYSVIRSSGGGTYSELGGGGGGGGGGYLNSLDTFVWRKSQSYGVILKIGGASAPLSAAYDQEQIVKWGLIV